MKNFNSIYEKIYKEYAVPLEEMRQTITKDRVKAFVIAALVCGGLSLIAQSLFYLVFVIPIMIVHEVMSKNVDQYEKFFKQNVVQTFVKEYSDTLEYIPNQGMSRITYDQGEFEGYDRYYTEDLIRGVLEDKYKVTMAEVHTRDESEDEDGNTTTTTVFFGLVAKVELNKMVNVNIKIRKDKLKIFDKKTRIQMDSGEFEKNFDVYSTDKIIAMQILTADVMQMLLDFKEKNKLRPELTLKGDSLYIRFDTGDLFEAQIMQNSLDYNTLKKYYDAINFTLDIVKEFVKNIEESEV